MYTFVVSKQLFLNILKLENYVLNQSRITAYKESKVFPKTNFDIDK